MPVVESQIQSTPNKASQGHVVAMTDTDKIPPWVDMETLSWAICASPHSIENYVAQGKLPPPRKLGAKRLWKWKEVEERLANGPPNNRIESMSNAVRRERDADETSRH